MLVRLMYASRAAESVNPEALNVILKQSKPRNVAAGVTGLLCFCANAGLFMQVLEGGRTQVNRLYNRIARDPRHRDIELLSYEEIVERHFAGWAMARVNMDGLNSALVLRYSDGAVLDPYTVSGQASLALFNELVATGSVVGPG